MRGPEKDRTPASSRNVDKGRGNSLEGRASKVNDEQKNQKSKNVCLPSALSMSPRRISRDLKLRAYLLVATGLYSASSSAAILGVSIGIASYMATSSGIPGKGIRWDVEFASVCMDHL